MRIGLSLLEQVAVASPCSVPWETMAGDDRIRFCGECSKYVYRFEEMSSADIRRLIEEKEGHLCAQLARRTDGTLITNDCPVGLERARKRRRLAKLFALVPLSFLAAAVGSAAFLMHSKPAPTALDAQPPNLEELKELWEDLQVRFGLKKPPPPVVFRTGGVIVLPRPPQR